VGATRLQQFQDAGGVLINESKNIIITVMAALAVIDGGMTLGMMLAIQYIIGQLNTPVNDLVSVSREWQDAKISLDRIGEVHLQQGEESTNDKSALSPVPASKSIEIKDLYFAYDGTQSPVLNGISLKIPEGKVTAIVGTSGSGKTTLMKLLVKFYTPQKGSIHVGNVDLNELSTSEWRQQCGAVMQDGFIFADTISGNVALSSDDIDVNKMLYSVRVASIGDFIESLPLRYNTKLGMNGIGLSQGQKQRILIARAVYKNPEMIFLDEATSSLDANNERVIMENLDQFLKNKTVVVIAHRLSTVKKADQIVVLEKGKIVETGTHAELSALRGKYFELVKNQLELGAQATHGYGPGSDNSEK